jgi:acyl-CoA thioester hydrolase
VDVHCRYASPTRYDDEVVVTTRIASANRRMVEFAYELCSHDGRGLATGETKHIYLGADLKPTKLPEKYYALFGIPS